MPIRPPSSADVKVYKFFLKFFFFPVYTPSLSNTLIHSLVRRLTVTEQGSNSRAVTK
jgi:hypothetical protein